MSAIFDFWHTIWIEPDIYWELLVAFGAIALGWLGKKAVIARLERKNGVWLFAAQAFRRILFPIIALVACFIGQAILSKFGVSVVLLSKFVLPLLSAMAMIRLVVYFLRYIFGANNWVVKFEKIIFWTVWFGFLLHVTGLLPELISALDAVSFTVGKHRFSLLLLINGLLTLVTILLITLWLGSLVEKRVMKAEALEMNLRVVLTRVLRVVLVIVGLLITLPIVGIDLTALSVFSGALGVGIGLGLQKVASNYVSGFIILLDRSIRLGDVIRVNDQQGIVQKLTSRYVVLAPNANAPATIIPADQLISSTVINLTYHQPRVRVGVPVQVAYESNLVRAEQLMIEAAKAHDRVLRDPEPSVLMLGFGESGINLELGVFIGDPENGDVPLRSDLNRKIWAAFKEHGIEIPYPRREVMHLSSPAANGAQGSVLEGTV